MFQKIRTQFTWGDAVQVKVGAVPERRPGALADVVGISEIEISMVLIHRVTLRATEAQRRALQALGVEAPAGVVLPGDRDPYVAFDVREDHPNWSGLQRLFREWGAGDVVTARFSKEEIEAATWIVLRPDWHHGYPQPNELEFGYLRATYDLTEWCDTCGIGLRQKAPFQMRNEPKWGRRGILQLNWVFDEYFVTPTIWSSVFKPCDVACRPVINRNGAELKTVVQLAIEEEVALSAEGVANERCAKCGRVKYLPVTSGFFPALATKPTHAIVKTREYFGSGAAADKRVLISRELARLLVTAKVRGASFWPVQSANSGPYL